MRKWRRFGRLRMPQTGQHLLVPLSTVRAAPPLCFWITMTAGAAMLTTLLPLGGPAPQQAQVQAQGLTGTATIALTRERAMATAALQQAVMTMESSLMPATAV